MAKGAVKVKEQRTGSAIALSEYTDGQEYATLQLQQMEVVIVEGRVKTLIRNAEIVGSLPDIIRTGYRVGSPLRGKIIIIQTTTPPIEDDPEQYLLWEGDKVVRTDDNKVIYEYSVYSENTNDHDIYLTGCPSKEEEI